MRRARFWMIIALVLLPGPAPWQRNSGQSFARAEIATAQIDGHAVKWAGWTFNWQIRPREGLTLTDVTFQGRSVLKFASWQEVFVPYHRGEPRPEDFGDGIARRLQPLIPGKDCTLGGTCQAFNAQGKEEGKRVVMIHEESTGLNYLGPRGRAYGKMLTVWCAYDMDGYYYICRWRFHDDGCLEPQVGLTGPLQFVSTGNASPHGSIVGKDKAFAPSHVHNFYFCLDFDIDGPDNNVVEEFNYKQDRPGSLSGKHSWTPITKESSRPSSAENFRFWRVVNKKSKNALGLPRSYELLPGGNGIFRGAKSETFAQAELWVTRFHEDEYPKETRRLGTALPGYLNDESVDGENVVVWYAMHVHHIARTEDWPSMPVEWVGFMLRPRDFLDASPVQPEP
jgi:primary-amine oxidase